MTAPVIESYRFIASDSQRNPTRMMNRSLFDSHAEQKPSTSHDLNRGDRSLGRSTGGNVGNCRQTAEKALHSANQANNQAGPERWPSGRRRSPAKGVYVKSVSRVRIPSSPPSDFPHTLLFIGSSVLELFAFVRSHSARRKMRLDKPDDAFSARLAKRYAVNILKVIDKNH